jgi:cytochrome c peroxidase
VISARRAVLLSLLLSACSARGVDTREHDDDVPPEAGEEPEANAPVPIVDAEQRERLATLRYDPAPAPPDPSNRVADDPLARSLGQALFFDPALSGPLLEADNDGSSAALGRQGEAGRVSCAGCHVPSAGFVDTRSPHRQISLAAGWTARRTPSLLEVGFAPLYNWDGRRDTIWNQALGVMESAAEFNSGRLFVAQQIKRLYQAPYERLFGPLPPLADTQRFPALTPEQAGCAEKLTKEGAIHVCHGKPGDQAEYDGMASADQEAVTRVAVNAAKALAAYVRQLRCGPGRFDAWLDGDTQALDESEQRGAALFVGRARCSACHAGARLTDDAFHNVGLSPAPVAVAFVDANDQGAAEGMTLALSDPLSARGIFSDGDRGALPVTVSPALLGAFRTPSLRCVSRHPSFMHTGQLRSLEQVVAFHNRGGDPMGGYPGTNELSPLGLTEAEQSDLVAFLRSLDGPGPDAQLLAP